MMKNQFLWSAFSQLLPCIVFSSNFYNQANITHTEPGGIGYTQGYTTASVFLTPKLYPKGYCFLEGKAHVFNNGKFASNLGFGVRWTPKQSLTSFGINVFYDNRLDYLFFHQVGGGIELQKNRFFFNTNVYHTLGCKKKNIQQTHYNYFEYYIKNVTTKIAFTNHIDAEAGVFILMNNKQKLYVGVGPYLLNSESLTTSNSKLTWGYKGHFHVTLNQLVNFKIFVSHDSLFKTKFQGQFSLTIPLSKSKRSSMFFSSVIRQEIIPLQTWNYWSWNY